MNEKETFRMPMPIPILRLEMENMKHSLSIALHDYAIGMDHDIQAAIAAYCTPERLSYIVSEEAFRVIIQVVKEEVKNFYVNGEGRRIVRQVVLEKLAENRTYTLADEPAP